MEKSLRLLLVFAALGILGAYRTASSACIVSPNTTLADTGATSVLDASGQGNFSCADMSPGPDGPPMINITDQVEVTVENSTSATITNVQGLPGNELDAVYIRAKGHGARCLYTYSDYSTGATNLQAGGDDFDVDDVIVCADGEGTEPPPEPEVIEPISTVGDGCVGEITVIIDGVEQTLDNLALVSAVSLDGSTLAVCNGTGDTASQVRCVNICQNFTPRAETPECAQANLDRGLTDGQMDLENCRPCDLTVLSAPPGTDKDGDPLFYCWEYTNSVVRDPTLNDPDPTNPNYIPYAPGTLYVPGTTDPRTLKTMLPHKQAWSTTEENGVYNVCYTKTVQLNGMSYTYSTCR